MLSRAEFLATLPRRRLAAGALIRDDSGRICLVEPTYKNYWLLPGGTIEADESPSAGCHRELVEELGLDLVIGPMLSMDWVAPASDDPHGALVFVYDGGVLDQETIDRIVTPSDELRSFRFVPESELDRYTTERNRNRILAAMSSAGGPVVELDRD
ncbi:MAG TPA: NUDIX hydrolase [Microlunatus sp.]